jgi:hypothetical protein
VASSAGDLLWTGYMVVWGLPEAEDLVQECAARTPLAVTPMQAVSAGPRRAPRSNLPLAPS